MIPWDQWWFWVLVIIFLIAVFEPFSDALVIRAFRGSPKELKKLKQEVERLKAELREAKAAQKVLELQRHLSMRELERIERQALPEGVAVLMFTDLEGFTAYVERHGDERALQTLQKHYELVRRCAERHGGTIVKELGDGFLLSFPSARRALLCAAEVQELMERSGLARELKVRIGLHAGEPVRVGAGMEREREGSPKDVLGHAVNVARRVMEEARGGEVVLSELVKELAGPLEGFQYVERGVRRLKGLNQPLTLYELQPVRALAHPLDSQIDRELRELERQLREEEGEGEGGEGGRPR